MKFFKFSTSSRALVDAATGIFQESDMDRVKRIGLGHLITLVLIYFASSVAFAQVDSGSLAGTVTDATGSVVTGAQVVATEQQSGTVYKSVTSSSGTYVFTSLRPGTYDVSVTSPTFSKAQVSALPIFVSTRASHDFTLTIGSVSDTVTVVASGPSLESESSDIGTVLTPTQVEELPLSVGGAFRSLTALAFLAPGAVGPGTNGGTTFTKIGGGQTEGSDFLIDGISTLRSENGTENFDQTTPAVEAIQEFRVETLSLPSYFGRTTGGLANFKSRSGENSYHGVIFDFFKNNGLDANNWFNNGNIGKAGNTAAARKQFKRALDTKNDYGVTFGGPLAIPHVYNGHDKTFFFFDFEQLKYHSGGVSLQTVPTDAQRTGDFSALLGTTPVPVATANNSNPCFSGAVVFMGEIFDPSTTKTVNGVECRQPFTNAAGQVTNIIPASRFSTVAKNVLALIPHANFVGTGTTNFSQSFTDQSTNTVYSLRVDQSVGARNHLFFFGSARENSDGGSLTLPYPLNDGNNVTDQFYKYLRAGWDFTITPHIVNQLTIGGNRVNSFNVSSATSTGTNFDSQLGIPNTPNAGTTFPIFGIGEGLPQLGSSNFDDNVDNALIGNDGVAIQKGRHSIQIGGTYRWQQFSYINNGTAAGNFSFGRAQTAGTNDPIVSSQSGNGIASFLLGVPGNISRTVQLHFPQWIQNYYAGYVQDDWKARPNLTLNLGFRYSVDTPRHERRGDTTSLDLTLANPGANGLPGALRFGGVGTGRDGNSTEQWASNYYKNFEPRVGFSYSPGWMHNTAVLRGSYAIMYGPLLYSDYGQGLTQGFTVHSGGSTTNNGDGYLPFGPLDAGPATTPTTPNLDPSQLNGNPGGTNPDLVKPTDGRPGMIQNWALETQTQLAPDLVLTLGYLGEHSVRLRALLNYPNDINPAYLGLGNTLFAAANSPQAQAAGIKVPFANFFNVWNNGQVQQALRPYPQYGYINEDSYLQNTGQSTYHALELKLERRFHNGLTLLTSYTWSKTLTDADSIQPFFATTLGQGGTQNPYNLKGEKSVSTQDVPTNFVISYLYDLPVGKGKRFLGNVPKAVDEAIAGWRIGGVQRYLSGQPISFFGAGGIPGFDNGIRFNRVPLVDPLTSFAKGGHFNPFSYAGPNSATAFFNRAAFVDPNANRGSGAFQFGTMPRNSADIRTPAYFNEDMNLSKVFPVRESLSIEFRAEAFNIFNRHVFGKPDSGVNDTNFGQVGGLNGGPRNLQMVLRIKY